MMVKTPTRTETEQAKKERSRPVALGKVNLLLALLALLVLAGAYWVGVLTQFLPEALALLVLILAPVTAASRAWHARRGGLEYGLLRHPFRRELRPYLLQCLNHWLFWALFGGAIVAGTFAIVPALVGSFFSLPLPERIPYLPLVITLGVGALVMAALALVPRRPTGAYLHPAGRPGRHRPAVGRRVGDARGGAQHAPQSPLLHSCCEGRPRLYAARRGGARLPRRSEAGGVLVRLRRARTRSGRRYGGKRQRRPPGRAHRRPWADAPLWQPHRPRD